MCVVCGVGKGIFSHQVLLHTTSYGSTVFFIISCWPLTVEQKVEEPM